MVHLTTSWNYLDVKHDRVTGYIREPNVKNTPYSVFQAWKNVQLFMEEFNEVFSSWKLSTLVGLTLDYLQAKTSFFCVWEWRRNLHENTFVNFFFFCWLFDLNFFIKKIKIFLYCGSVKQSWNHTVKSINHIF